MTDKTIAPYGSWKSPITSDLLVGDKVGLGAARLEGTDTHWLEIRPQEGGRSVIVCRGSDGKIADRTPPNFNVRTRVHEYGGGAYQVDAGTVFFSNFDDNRLYRQERGDDPSPITLAGPWRYADCAVDRARNRAICVREDHSRTGTEAVNTIVALSLDGTGEQRELLSGNDFYSTPRLSPDGSHLAWLTWNHPNMPWDGTELWVARIETDGGLTDERMVSGGSDESIFQPAWSPDGILYFVSDRTGWWNIYRESNGAIESVTHLQAELGAPQWTFDVATYGFANAETIYCLVNNMGTEDLARVDTLNGELQRIETEYSSFSDIEVGPERVIVVGSSPTRSWEVGQISIRDHSVKVLRRSTSVSLDTEYISQAQPIEFPTENGLTAHAFYYSPHNPNFAAPVGDVPPLIVASHGGPTGSTSAGLQLDAVQFWTSRGIAVVDVNYGGSTGYGRPYRERLHGQWGVVDVDDCVNAARYLASRGLADPNRLIIHGGSAGGYTTLAALAFRDVFAAGCSYFGIGDLEIFVGDTHKFESRYLESLVGRYPEQRALYKERSPINAIDRISCPVIQFQGEDDKVVPPNQARLMQEALDQKGLPNAALFFPGEGHGFRKAENIKRQFDGELYFYSCIFGFELPDAVEPVPISNL